MWTATHKELDRIVLDTLIYQGVDLDWLDLICVLSRNMALTLGNVWI